MAWQRAEHIPDDLARRELAQFRDYWAAAAGRNASKMDWGAAWRNWLRRTEDTRRPRQDRPLEPAINTWTPPADLA